jgi:hypothetical protein
MVDFAQQRPECRADVGNSADRDAAEIDPVIAALAADQPHPVGLAVGDVERARHLQRGVGGLAPRIDEEAAFEAVGKNGCERLGRREGERVPHLERRRIIELAYGFGDGLDDLAPAMARVDAPQAGGAVEDRPVVRREVMHAFGPGEQARRRLILPVGGERHPPALKVRGRGLRRVGHRRRLYEPLVNHRNGCIHHERRDGMKPGSAPGCSAGAS